MTREYPSIKKLTAYLNGELSSTEADEVIDWFNQSEETKKELSQLQIIWGLSDRLNQMEEINKQKTKNAVNLRIKASKNRRKLYINYFQRVAAILIFPILLLSAWLLIFQSNNNKLVEQEFVATWGTRTSLVLPDSTKVWLNSGSKLKFGQDFNKDLRTVYLTGEAFFDVNADKSRPFDVVTKSFTVRAVGTEFNVCSYIESDFETSLEEGKVLLFRSGQVTSKPLLKMEPGQRVLWDNNKITVSDDDVKRFSAWREGRLIFKDTPFTEALPKMERWFNVDIELSDPEILKYRFTAIFEKETIQQAFDMLSFSSAIKYEIVPGARQADETYSRSKIKISKQ